MKDTLLYSRAKYDAWISKLEKIDNPEVRNTMIGQLVDSESLAEFNYRSGMLKGEIRGMGLEKYMAQIIDGMNQSAVGYYPSDISKFNSTRHFQAISRAHGDALLIFGQEYIKRWNMYNDMFGDKE